MERSFGAGDRRKPEVVLDVCWRSGQATTRTRDAARWKSDVQQSGDYAERRNFGLQRLAASIPAALIARVAGAGLVHLVAFDRHKFRFRRWCLGPCYLRPGSKRQPWPLLLRYSECVLVCFDL